MSKLAVMADFWSLFRYNKKWWLLPIATVLLIMGSLMVFVGGSAIAPFIYSIF